MASCGAEESRKLRARPVRDAEAKRSSVEVTAQSGPDIEIATFRMAPAVAESDVGGLEGPSITSSSTGISRPRGSRIKQYLA